MRSKPENRRERKNTVAPAAQAITAGSTESRNGALFGRESEFGGFRFSAKAPIAYSQASQWQEPNAPVTYHDHNSGNQHQCCASPEGAPPMPALEPVGHLGGGGDRLTDGNRRPPISLCPPLQRSQG